MPDFSFPDKVLKNADAAYSAAMKRADYPAALRALIDSSIASTSINPDSAATTAAAVEKFAARAEGSPSSALACLFAAKIYSDIYSARRWVYDSRTAPLLPLGSDVAQWTGKQFKYKINSLCSSALATADNTAKSPVTDWKSLITIPAGSTTICPTLYDFIAAKSLEFMTRYCSSDAKLPVSVLVPEARLGSVVSSLESSRPEAAAILGIYSKLSSIHSSNPMPRTYWTLKRIDYTCSRIYPSDFSKALAVKDSLLRSIYSELKGSEASCLPLIQLAENTAVDSKNAAEIYSWLKDAARRYPTFAQIACIKNRIAALSAKSAEIQCNTLITPGDTLSISVNGFNIPSATITLYRLPDNAYSTDTYAGIGRGAVVVERKPLSFKGSVPFKAEARTGFKISAPGRYIVVPSFSGASMRGNTYPIVHATSLCAGALIFDKSCVVVTEPLSGAPVSGADIITFSGRGRSRSKLGSTDASGFLSLKADFSGNIKPEKGSDTSAMTTYIYSIGRSQAPVQAINIYTDLGIYHPGDSMQWACAAYRSIGSNSAPIESARIEVIFRDANSTPVDTVTATTDGFGRIAGSFIVPEGMLTGRYSISAATVDNNESRATGSISFMVSDYKLPTFAVEISSVKANTPAQGDVCISGKVRTYSGMPLAGAGVNLTLASIPDWWRGSFSSVEFFNASTLTGADGSFHIIVTDSDFSLAPNPQGNFSAKIDATSSSGESQSASKVFARGAAYRISAALPANIDISAPVAIDVKVFDADGKSSAVKLTYTIVDARSGDTVGRGDFAPGSRINLASIASGVYDITFASLTPRLANPVTVSDIALYSPTDAMPPRKSPLWIPERSVAAGDSILIGTSAPKTYVLYTLWSPGKIHSSTWLQLAPGMHYISPSLPAGEKSLTASFMSVYNYVTTAADVAVKIPDPQSNLSIVVESWRDRLVPGARETITLRVANGDSTGTPAAVMLDMYNTALSNLAEPSFSFYTRKGYQPILRAISPVDYIERSYNLSSATRFLSCPDLNVPELNTYGKSFAGSRRNGMIMYSRAAGAMLKADAVHDEMKMAVTEEVAEDMAYDVAEHSEALAPDAGAAESAAPAPQFAYRDSEVPLAFFAPMLTTAPDGSLAYTFTVPNANTSWTLRALAFDKAINPATASATATAAKPVMVQPNLPRFLRAGDSVEIRATVFNNEATPAGISTEIQFFDPATGATLSASECSDTIAANSSADITTQFTAPATSSMIGYRIKSSNGRYADGEQSIIPILPATSTTYESTDFYLSADATRSAIDLPQYPADAKVTLTYCANPLWYVVTALPGLQKCDIESATAAAASIFSAAVAKGLTERYPEIRKAIDAWSQSDKSDSTLTSMLSRNADLKSFLLQATPWVNDAQTDTERMQRLSLLYNNKEYESTLASSIALLDKLQSADGGIAWIAQYREASLWATTSVLSTIGVLNRLNMMPSDKKLADICSKALAYMQRQYTDIYSRHPHSSFATYARVASLWPGFKPSAIGRSMISREVQTILASWKNMSPADKADAAMLLHSTGNTASARTIMASVAQFATSTPQQGMWWPALADRSASLSQIAETADILTAYATITPQSADIDRIRQWLILQKANMNWGESATVSKVIAAILTSSPSWIKSAGNVKVKLGSRRLTPEAAPYTGEFRISLDAAKASGAVLSFDRAATPAWGAVTAISTSAMGSIGAASCQQLAISKTVYVKDGDGWKQPDSLKVGDKIKISLTIRSEASIDYVAISDERAACLEPVQQTPSPIWADGICFYRENNDTQTNIFIDRLPKGTFVLEYEMWINNSGSFASGIATAQSQYSPQISAHSAGGRIEVK